MLDQILGLQHKVAKMKGLDKSEFVTKTQFLWRLKYWGFEWRNWLLASNSKFLIVVSLQPLQTLNHVKVWNIWGLQHWFAKILGLKNQSLWQRLNSFIQMRKLIKVSFMDLTLSRMGGGIFHLPLFVIFLYSIKTSYTKALNLLHFLSIIKYNYFFQHFSDVLFERLKPT